MNLTTLLILVAIVAIAYVGYRVLEGFKALQEGRKDDQALLMLQKQLFEIEKGLKAQDKSINDQLGKSRESMAQSLQQQFAASAKIIKEVVESTKSVSERLTKLDETNKQVVGFAEQMKSLENILKNPKQRGILGEFFLENLLSGQLSPSQYKMQYGFKNGEIVDAAIFIRDKIIPIDAKFSLENYNKIMEEKNADAREKQERKFKEDLKLRIDETAKYVRPQEDTTDFAFMFIPADGVFYNLLSMRVGTLEVNTHDLIEYAFSKRVILVSPMTFYAYLQTVMQGLKALKIEESAREIQKRVGDLGRHLNAYQDSMAKVGLHLNTTVSSYNNAAKEFVKIDKDVIKITDGEVTLKPELPEPDRPHAFDEADSPKVKVELKSARQKSVAERLEL
jgi:DNA recombination protein RmuC